MRKAENSKGTYRCCSEFDMIDIHPVVGELQTSEVPVGPGQVNFQFLQRDHRTAVGYRNALKTHKFDRIGNIGENIDALTGRIDG